MLRAVRELQRVVHPDRWTGSAALVNAEAFKTLGGPVSEMAALCDGGKTHAFARVPLTVRMVLPSGKLALRLPSDGSLCDAGIGVEDMTRALISAFRCAKIWTERTEEKPEETPMPRIEEMRLDLRNVRVWRGLSPEDARTALCSIWRSRTLFAAMDPRSAHFVVGGPPLPIFLKRSFVPLPVDFGPDEVVSAFAAVDADSCVA